MAEKLASLKKTGSKNGYVHRGTFPSNGKLKCGFKPTSIMLVDTAYVSGTYSLVAWYDASVSTTTNKAILAKSTEARLLTATIGVDSSFASIDNDGITMNTRYSGNFSANTYLIAVKE